MWQYIGNSNYQEAITLFRQHKVLQRFRHITSVVNNEYEFSQTVGWKGNHWLTVDIIPENLSIYVYDSAHTYSERRPVLENRIRKMIIALYYSHNVECPINQYRIVHIENVANQRTGTLDCGVAAIASFKSILEQQPLIPEEEYSKLPETSQLCSACLQIRIFLHRKNRSTVSNYSRNKKR